jgi:hypothetical protein
VRASSLNYPALATSPAVGLAPCFVGDHPRVLSSRAPILTQWWRNMCGDHMDNDGRRSLEHSTALCCLVVIIPNYASHRCPYGRRTCCATTNRLLEDALNGALKEAAIS